MLSGGWRALEANVWGLCHWRLRDFVDKIGALSHDVTPFPSKRAFSLQWWHKKWGGEIMKTQNGSVCGGPISIYLRVEVLYWSSSNILDEHIQPSTHSIAENYLPTCLAAPTSSFPSKCIFVGLFFFNQNLIVLFK